MLAEGLRVAVRPRGILECLDVSVMFCGRRPLPVAVATAVGAVPCMLFNRACFAGAEDDAASLALVVLGIEAAWAAVPLTLYIGQSVFSNRFSWRAAARDFVGGLPALVLFQSLLRGVCLATVILAPLAFVGMYYVGQIILLERPALSRIWRRRGAMNRGRLGAIIALQAVDGLVIAVGTTLGIDFLSASSRLWCGRDIVGGASAWQADLVATLFSWHGQIAFWSVCGFLTVFRFFTYIDMRIRREGWDVELGFRAEETYAGLPRHVAGRPRTAAVAILAVACLVGAAGAVHAAGGSAVSTTESSSARRALARQSFPWYDSAADRYRPIDGPPSQPVVDSPGSSVPAEVLGVLGWAAFTAVLVAVAAGLTFLVIRHGLGERRHDDGGGTAGAAGTCDVHADPPPSAGVAAVEADLLLRAAAVAERGDYSGAIIFFQAWLLMELHRQGRLVLAPGKTTGQYRAEVAAADPGISALFAASCRLFEDAFFGHLAIDRLAFLQVWERRSEFVATAPGGLSP